MDTPFLLDYEVEAHGCLPDHVREVVSRHPRGIYEIYVTNLSTKRGTDRPLLSVQIVISASDIAAAKDVGRQALSRYLDLLTFATNLKFELHKLIRIINWTKGPQQRQCIQYQPFPGHEIPMPVLAKEIFKSVEVLEEGDISDRLRRILRWFARGVRSVYPDDQFQYFWFVLELLAQIDKSPERVSDLCAKCRSPLYCETCGTHPKHRPYPKQAILALFRRIVADEPDSFFEQTNQVRNCIMHGDDIREIEAELGIKLAELVDKLGSVAWVGISNALCKSFKVEPS